VGKPSIFSSGYEKRMRKRRKRIFIIVTSSIIVAAIVVVVFMGSLGIANKKIVSSETNNKKNTSSKKTSDVKVKTKKSNENDAKTIVTSNFMINMPSGKQAKVIYDNTSTGKVIKSVDNSDPDLDYNINPSGSAVVLVQKSTQDIVLANADGTSSNITNANYTSTTGTVFSKATVLKANPSYIWCASPKFIDDTNIAYISQLPWFQKTNKYIWKYNTQNKTTVNTNITGQNVQINSITPKGLEIITDNSTQYLKGDGSVTN
jgi:hypothetical protein